MFEKIKNIFKKKSKEKEVLILDEDKTFENEVKKPEVKEIKETVSETKSETKS